MPSNESIGKFVDPAGWAEFERLEKVISSAADSFEYLSLTAMSSFKSFGNIGTLKELVELTKKSSEMNIAVTETVKKQSGALKDYNLQLLEANISIKDRNALLKLQTAAEAAPAGSIAKVRAEAALMRRELMLINTETQKGRQEFLKAELLKKDAYIKNNVDGYTAQKINIGNYPDLIKQFHALNEEMKQMEATGQKISPEFEALAGKITDVKSAISGMTSSGQGFNGLSGQLSSVNHQMQELEKEGKKDTDQFHKLVTEAQLLHQAMEGVSAESKETTKAVSSINDRLKGFGQSVVAMAATYVSFQALQTLITDSIKEFSDADEAAGRLKNTLEQYDNLQAFTRLAAQSEELAEKFKYLDNDALNEVFNKLLTYGKLTEEQLNSLLPVIVDFAAKEKLSVTDASETIIKALEGNGKALKVYGVNMKEAAEGTESATTPAERLSIIMSELKPKVEGAAAAFGKTFPGTLATMKQQFADIQESIGRFIVKLSGVEEASLKAAVSAKKEAEEGQKLIAEYEALSKKVGQTSEDKKRLSEITTSLTSIFGDSVVEIDKETGALKLNIEATKDLIKQKLLLANSEGAKAALEYNAAEEKRKANAEGLTKAQLLYNDAVKRTGETIEDIQNKRAYTKGGNIIDNLTPAEKDIVKLNDNVNNYKKELDKYLNLKIEAADKLRKLGFNEGDVDKLFGGNKPLVPTGDQDASGKVKKVKDNSLNNETQHITEVYEGMAKEAELSAAFQKKIVDDESKSLEERLTAYRQFAELTLDAQTLRGVGEMEIINNDLKAIEVIEAKSADKRTQQEKDLLGRKATIKQQYLNKSAEYDLIELEHVEKTAEEIVKIQQNEVNKRLDAIKYLSVNADGLQADALRKLSDSLLNSEIGYKEYVDKKTKLEADFEKKKYADLIDYLNEEISALSAQGVNTTALQEQLNAAKNHLYDVDLKNFEDKEKQKTELQGQVAQKSWELADASVNLGKTLADQYYESQLQHEQELSEAIERRKNAQISAIEKSLMSEKDKAFAIKSINEQALLQQMTIDREQRRIKRQQAISDRVAALFGVGLAQAQAQAANLVNYVKNPIYGAALAALIAGLGLVQTGAILAQPLPAYKYGTPKDGVGHPGGKAWLGDGYKREAVFEPDKEPYWSASTPTVYDLPKYTRVVPEADLLAGSMGVDYSSLMPLVNIRNDFSQLETAIKATADRMETAVKNIPVNKFSLNNGQLQKVVEIGGTKITYINSNFD